MDETSTSSDADGTADAVDRALTDRLLHDAGLPDAEARLYRLLRHVPNTDAATLAWRLDSPPGTVAKQLRRLVRRGFAATDGGEPARYRAVDPALAVHLAVVRREHSLLAALSRVGRASAAVPALAGATAADRRRHNQPDPPVTVLDPADSARARADVAAAATTTLRRVVTTPGRVTPLASVATERRTLYRRTLLNDDAIYQQAERELLRGTDVRLLPDPGPELLAADDHTALLHDDGPTLLVTPSPLLDLTLRCFDQAWDRAIPLDGGTGANTAWAISDDDRDLLRLLAAGLKDQAIARHLDIGLRTVVRRIGTLARTLDAETRFQLGLQARARDLI